MSLACYGFMFLVIVLPMFKINGNILGREADYTLDDSFWNEETPAGEVERLLRQYQQNEELVKNIGAHFYQIIYPVQLRHHEKMGISTREAGIPRFPQKSSYNEGVFPRPRTRTGKHFHRTSLLIKAFNHRFRLDLELNTQLLAPNLVQKDYLINGAEQISKQEIEHCYYHGTVKDYPGASAAFHTCNGVSGVIHLGNETFVIHPFYGGDMSKHPHVIFEARTKAMKGCANSGTLEWRTKARRQKQLKSPLENITVRYKRDVREVTKYIETAVFIDKTMFDKRNGSTRAEVVHDMIQVANIADLYFRTLNTRVSVVYIETWQGGNQITVDKNTDISRALLNFDDYKTRMFQTTHDTAQLLTGENFVGGEAGIAVPETVCSQKSLGISVDLNIYEPHLLAGTMAHMIGHNIGMSHDDDRSGCRCHDWHGCIMAQSIIGLENVQPYKFSECSKADYIAALKDGKDVCLLNKPNELEVRRLCGNRIIDEGEQCDCGTIDECQNLDPCCDAITCKLTRESECASGPCCKNCKLQQRGFICREATNECDLPEFCTGDNGQCPTDVYKKNGHICAHGDGFCFNGICPSINLQCEQIWGYGGIAADQECFEQFNPKGAINGHCGTDVSGHFIKCESNNVRCGLLQCQEGSNQPIIDGINTLYSRTIISNKGKEYECKATMEDKAEIEKSILSIGLVRDGSPCGDNLICINQTCTNQFPHIDLDKCPSNHDNHQCSGHGICNNLNRCYCDIGWSGPDCSLRQEQTLEPITSSTESSLSSSSKNKMEKKETPYENYHGSNTVYLVITLMSVVGGVFVVFAMMALCYRSVVVHKNFSLCLRVGNAGIKRRRSAQASPVAGAADNENKLPSVAQLPSASTNIRPRKLKRRNQSESSTGTLSQIWVALTAVPRWIYRPEVNQSITDAANAVFRVESEAVHRTTTQAEQQASLPPQDKSLGDRVALNVLVVATELPAHANAPNDRTGSTFLYADSDRSASTKYHAPRVSSWVENWEREVWHGDRLKTSGLPEMTKNFEYGILW
ncbi:disintegrin and metalloproteinase domain-containing protein 11 [Phymastichus coffea]|uniref:disintegrin and metalloproteinase domain-containing protein 11 n=1 Tax=Phymastichus coffea TaxID=108790 RepID=UPI00273B5E0B|nr:disintegrin and metalloproteinase domain-containing protein 11 [Phymastichus coffea]